jgi:cell division protein FtsB
MKKDEKLKMLEQSVKWLRDESVALASNIEELRAANRTLRQKVRLVEDEKSQQAEQIITLTHHNILLKRTVEQLKSPALIAKYERNGKEKAEERMWK